MPAGLRRAGPPRLRHDARRGAAGRRRAPPSATCSTIITTPASFWSVSGESPSRRTGWSTYVENSGSKPNRITYAMIWPVQKTSAVKPSRSPRVRRWWRDGSMICVQTSRPPTTKLECMRSCQYAMVERGLVEAGDVPGDECDDPDRVADARAEQEASSRRSHRAAPVGRAGHAAGRTRTAGHARRRR